MPLFRRPVTQIPCVIFFPTKFHKDPALVWVWVTYFLTVCIWLPFCALWKEMCLFLSVFITSPHSSAVIRLSDSDVFLCFQHIPRLSLTLQTKILQHMHKERWHRSLLFPVQRVHPCLTITDCSCTFLPSFLVDLWPDKLGGLPWRRAFFYLWDTGSESLDEESNQHSYWPAPLKDAVWWERNSWRKRFRLQDFKSTSHERIPGDIRDLHSHGAAHGFAML